MEPPKQQPLLRANSWFVGLTLVKFDFDEGQLVEDIYPSGLFSKAQEKSIAMLSFPDSNAFDTNEGTLKYVFRLKRENGRYLFGFVCFKQKKDPAIFRGYFQKSLVILSEIPLLSFFSTLSEFLVFKLFGNDQLKFKLESIYKQIAKWPHPEPFASLKLSVLGYDFNILVPTYLPSHILPKNKHNNKLLTLDNISQLGYFQETSILESYRKVIPLLWCIWEVILLNKPLMIVAENPSIASNAVLCAISLISPLMFGGDYKPYMTVYDSQFHAIQKRSNEKPDRHAIVIGVTNPLFLKSLKTFPNILCLNAPNQTKALKTRVKPDKEFCKLLSDFQSSKETDQLIESLLRRHFKKLTELFLQQLQVYFLQQVNDLKQFQKEQFIKFLKGEKLEAGPCFESKKSLIKLYSEFCECLNFDRFLISRNVIRAP